jgi:hypothetical protein
MFTLLVDFNEIRDDRVRGLQRYATGPRALEPEDRVLVHDDGEEEAWGAVEAVEGGLVHVRVDWATFGPAGRFHYLPNGGWVAGSAKIVIGERGEPNRLQVIDASDDALVPHVEEHSAKLPA